MERPEIFVIVQGFLYDRPGEVYIATSNDLTLIRGANGLPGRVNGRGPSENAAMDDLYHNIKASLPEITFIRVDNRRRSYPEALEPESKMAASNGGLERDVYESLLAEIHPAVKAGNNQRVLSIFRRLTGEGSSGQMWAALGRLQTTYQFAFYRDMVAVKIKQA